MTDFVRQFTVERNQADAAEWSRGEHGVDNRHESERIEDRALLVLVLQRLSEDLGHPNHMHETAKQLLPLLKENVERYARRLR